MDFSDQSLYYGSDLIQIKFSFWELSIYENSFDLFVSFLKS